MTDDGRVVELKFQVACFESNTREHEYDTALRPCMKWRPRLFIDGNQWCALYGENLQDGVAGFGDSPEAAMLAFDREWVTPLKAAGKAPSNG